MVYSLWKQVPQGGEAKWPSPEKPTMDEKLLEIGQGKKSCWKSDIIGQGKKSCWKSKIGHYRPREEKVLQNENRTREEKLLEIKNRTREEKLLETRNRTLSDKGRKAVGNRKSDIIGQGKKICW